MLEQNTAQTIDFIRTGMQFMPDTGIILGSGLGQLANEIEVVKKIPYEDIPGFPVSTVEGHAGQLIFGQLAGQKVVAMQGRFHYYEGYSMQEITFPIRIMGHLGIKQLLLSNACGGLNPAYQVGDLMVLDDHINMFFDNPLMGKNDSKEGPRFLDMSAPYDPEMIKKALGLASNKQIDLHVGVYAAVSGPCFETRAELRFLRTIGADVVGMSTIPEVIVARHMGIKCFAISVVTDIALPDVSTAVSHEEVLEAANLAAPKMMTVFKDLISSIN